LATWKDVLIYYFHKNNFLGLFHKQKNQGTEEEQDRVMLDPSGTMVEECGELSMIWIPETGVNNDSSREHVDKVTITFIIATNFERTSMNFSHS